MTQTTTTHTVTLIDTDNRSHTGTVVEVDGILYLVTTRSGTLSDPEMVPIWPW